MSVIAVSDIIVASKSGSSPKAPAAGPDNSPARCRERSPAGRPVDGPGRQFASTFGLLIAGLALVAGCVAGAENSGSDRPGDPPHPCRRAVDRDVDDRVEELTTWRLSESGRPLERRLDRNADQRADAVATWTYTDGRKSEKRSDIQPDGRDDVSTTWTYEDGEKSRKEVDGGAGRATIDGEPDAVTTWSHEGGRRTEKRVDENADGTPESLVQWRYEDNGRRIHKSIDRATAGNPPDGEPEETVVIERDEHDRRLRRRTNGDAEGDFERETRWAYRPAGGVRRRRMDLNGDGTFESVARWTYDDRDRKIRRGEDRDNDGDPEVITRWSYTCDVDEIEIPTRRR